MQPGVETLYLNQIKVGDSAIIDQIMDPLFASRLLSMGISVGDVVTLERTAPWGGPLAIRSGSLFISLRTTEAATIAVTRCAHG